MGRSSRAGLAARIALPVILVVICGYVLQQRSAARVGVDRLTFIPRLGEGFLCVGTCRDKPGVVILSRLSRQAVAVHADTESVFRRTTLVIKRNGRTEHHPLEEAAVVLIAEGEPVSILPVDWATATFPALLQAVDCDRDHDSSADHPRCGRPFVEMMEFLREHPPGKIPPELAAFAEASRG